MADRKEKKFSFKHPVEAREAIIAIALVFTFAHACDQQTRIDSMSQTMKRILNEQVAKSPKNIAPSQSPPQMTEAEKQAKLEDEVRKKFHLYRQEIDKAYYYELPPSEEDEKNNRGTRDVVVARYFGKDAKGYHIIKLYNQDGSVSHSKIICIDPCSVINYNGKIITAGQTAINDVTRDAVNGALLVTEISTKTKKSQTN